MLLLERESCCCNKPSAQLKFGHRTNPMILSLGAAEQYLPVTQQSSYRPDEIVLMTKKVCNRM